MRRHQISIHALREEGDLYPSRSRHIRLISIHALREEGDPLPPGPAAEHKDFYPRPPRGGRPLRFCPSAPEKNDFYPRPPRGGRRSYGSPQKSLHPFLSTPSARRATYRRVPHGHPTQDFYPRPPRGGRPFPGLPAPAVPNFYPRPPRGGRHLESVMLEQTDIDFYPRPPRGGRPIKKYGYDVAVQFLSTPSARRATRKRGGISMSRIISIHALREEGDLDRGLVFFRHDISIHALREEGDCNTGDRGRRGGYFYPRPPRGGRRHSNARLSGQF